MLILLCGTCHSKCKIDELTGQSCTTPSSFPDPQNGDARREQVVVVALSSISVGEYQKKKRCLHSLTLSSTSRFGSRRSLSRTHHVFPLPIEPCGDRTRAAAAPQPEATRPYQSSYHLEGISWQELDDGPSLIRAVPASGGDVLTFPGHQTSAEPSGCMDLTESKQNSSPSLLVRAQEKAIMERRLMTTPVLQKKKKMTTPVSRNEHGVVLVRRQQGPQPRDRRPF